MYSRRHIPALLMLAFLAMPALDTKAQPISTSAGAVIEVTVEPLRNGKPPQDVRCVERVKVVKGKASIQSFSGARQEIPEGEEVCITPSGQLISASSAALAPGSGPPSAGPTPPTIPCVTMCNGNSGIQIR